jgi:hypothetical protein
MKLGNTNYLVDIVIFKWKFFLMATKFS